MDFLISYISQVLFGINMLFIFLAISIGMTILIDYVASFEFNKPHMFTLKQLVTAFVVCVMIAIFTPTNLKETVISDYRNKNTKLFAENLELKTALNNRDTELNKVILFLKVNNLGDKYVQFVEGK